MLDTNQITIYTIGFFVLLGIGAIIGALKLLDWFISLKYVTHKKCEHCRSEIYKSVAIDHDLLKELNTKMDLVLEKLDFTK